MSGWEEWLNMTPKQHWEWMNEVTQECIEVELLELIRRAADGKKVIVDTNIPPDVLREISSYDRVAIMLCDPPDVCVTRFFRRDDPDKRFMLEQIQRCKDPERTLKNFNSWPLYHPPVDIDWQHTGFFTYTRSDFEQDTREEVLAALAKHFGLCEQ